MEKKKTKVDTSDNPITAQAVPKLSTVPEEGEDKVAARSVSSSVSSDNQASTIARATERLEDTEEPAATIDRARMIKSIQRSVGNTRVESMLAGDVVTRTSSPAIQRKEPPPAQTARQDVVVIVGRPSQTIPAKENAQDKENMEAWRAAAHALSPVVFEGMTVDRAFLGLKRMKTPIGKLYIIAHADVSGVGEVSPEGVSVSTTIEDLTNRMKKAAGSLGERKPLSVEMLSCYGGGSPKTMGRIGEALGASKVRAPIQMTVISGRTIKINGVTLTAAKMQKLSDKKLIEYIQKTDALKRYDFVPGVPHPPMPPSNEDKLKAMASVLRRTGMIPFISFNEPPGERGATEFWKASVQKRGKGEKLSAEEKFFSKDLIEVDIQEPEKAP
jgi:hypothetical protein